MKKLFYILLVIILGCCTVSIFACDNNDDEEGNIYSINFTVGDTLIESVSYSTDDKFVKEPIIPNKDYYSGEWESYILEYKKDQIVQAIYSPIAYNIFFKVNGENLSVQTYTIEDKSGVCNPTIPNNVKKDYYDSHWEDYELNGGDKNVEIVYVPIDYKVIFKADNNDSIVKTYNINTKDSFEEPAVPNEKYYSGEWEDFELNFSNGQVVNAVYTPIEYTITFKAEGFDDIVKTYTIENKDYFKQPVVPDKDGYKGEWETYTLNFDNNLIVNAIYTPTSEQKNVITFKADGFDDIKVYYIDESDFIEPEVPNKDYYTGEWNSYSLENNAIVEATYTLTEYTIIFKDYNGNTVNGGVKHYTFEEQSFTEPAVPNREHYEKGKWKYTLNFDSKHEQIVTPTYTPIEYTVTFKAEGSNDIELKYTADSLDSFEEPTVPHKEFYNGEWETYALNYDNNQVINAVYTPIEYTVTFMAENIKVGKVQSYTINDTSSVVIPTVPLKANMNGEWEAFELNGGNKIVRAIYKAIGDVLIKFDTSVIYLANGKEEKITYNGSFSDISIKNGDLFSLPQITNFSIGTSEYNEIKWVFKKADGRFVVIETGDVFYESNFRTDKDVAVEEITLYMQCMDNTLWTPNY